MNDAQWDAKYDAVLANLKPKITDDFLSTLVQAARSDLCGDWVEIYYFVRECFYLAGRPFPEEAMKHTFMDEWEKAQES